jgi:hypothetical protein
MRKFIACLVLCLASIVGLQAQDKPSQALLYAWQTPTTTGQLGNYLNLIVDPNTPPPFNYTIDWSLSGTAPAACTFRLEGSFDNVNWFGLDTTAPATTSCTTSNMESIVYKPVNYIRINVVSWTTGDGTTKVIFHFTGTR